MSRMIRAIQIDQPTAVNWELNCQQAMVLSVLVQLPHWDWTSPTSIEGVNHWHYWYRINKKDLAEFLPLLTNKPDTAWRYLKQLADKGLIELATDEQNKTCFRLSESAQEWFAYRGTP